MHIAIWHWSKQPFNGATVRSEPSGGTETAIAYTCEALARAGHRVSVYCHTPDDLDVEGVAYRSARGFAERVRDESFDAFVVVRHLAAFTTPVRTRALAYWTHDNLEQPFLHGMFRYFVTRGEAQRMMSCFGLGQLMQAGTVDAVFAVSQWQARAIAERFDVPADRIDVIGNGLQPDLFDPAVGLADRKPIILYSLPPDRGLLPLLEVFAQVKARVRNAELHAYSRSTIYGATLEEDEAVYGQVYELLRSLPGAYHHDPVDQRTLAAAMSRAMVYAYPTDTAETFCISILEAQAAGAVPVSSRVGAIPERIEGGVDGYLISGATDSPEYLASFARHVIKLLRDPDIHFTMASAARSRAHAPRYSYDAVAERMLARLERAADQHALEARSFDPREASLDLRARTTTGEPGSPLPASRIEELQRQFTELLHLA